MQTLYRTEILRMDGGERFALLVDKRTGVPDPVAVRFGVSNLRPYSVSSGDKFLKAIGLFYEWAEENFIDLDERFGTGDLFDQDEVGSLAERLRLSKRKTVDVGGVAVPAPVIGDTHGNRVRHVADFIKWRAQRIVRNIPVSDPRVGPAGERLRLVLDQLASLATSGGAKVRLGLTEEQQQRLFRIARPDSPENPFHPETRYRNFVLLLLYWELGLRKAEPLVLKHGDVQASGRMPRIVVEPRPDDPDDPRRLPPLVKTAGRVLPTSSLLTRSLDHYLIHVRSKVRNAKRSPYVFLETEEGRPMSLSAVYDVFTVLRGRFIDDFGPDFSTHVLRHTFFDRFKRKAAELGLTDAKRRMVGNYVMGWSKTSEQDANYGRRETEESAERVLLALQSQMLDVAA